MVGRSVPPPSSPSRFFCPRASLRLLSVVGFRERRRLTGRGRGAERGGREREERREERDETD